MTPSDETDAPPFFTRYGFTRPPDDPRALEIEPYDAICRHDTLRATVVASAIDLVGGFVTREAAGADLTFTRDLSLRIATPDRPPRLVARGEPLHAGRQLVTTAVRLSAPGDDGGAPFAIGETTFTRRPRPKADDRSFAELSTPPEIPRHDLAQPLADALGLTPIEPADGRFRLELRPAVLNPEGVMQGALVALVVEEAALGAAEATSGRPNAVVAMDLRYLAGASVGPLASRVEWFGKRWDGVLRVELVDEGRDRVTTTAFVRLVER